MNTVKFEKGSTLAVAHRGLSALERENTLPAFIAAFTSRKSLSTKELTEIKKLLASLEEARL